MKRIYKYPLGPNITVVHSYAGPVRRVGIDSAGAPCVWIELDPKTPIIKRTFLLLGTGHQIPEEPLEFLGSMKHDDQFIWFVYEAT